MKCLLVSDLHYVLPQYDWLLAAAAHGDVVIIADPLVAVCGADKTPLPVLQIRRCR